MSKIVWIFLGFFKHQFKDRSNLHNRGHSNLCCLETWKRNLSIASFTLWQYGLWDFQTGCKKLERFLDKNQHTQRIFFKNRSMNYGSSKSAKIVLTMSIFYVKNQSIFFKKNFIQEYQFRRPFVGKNIFFLIQFSNHFTF